MSVIVSLSSVFFLLPLHLLFAETHSQLFPEGKYSSVCFELRAYRRGAALSSLLQY